jgi:hypothetical protein
MHNENMQICQELVFNKKNLELLTHASLILPSPCTNPNISVYNFNLASFSQDSQTTPFLLYFEHESFYFSRDSQTTLCAISFVFLTREFFGLQIVGINELGTFLEIQN